MKKIIASVLTLVMIFSISTIGFAQTLTSNNIPLPVSQKSTDKSVKALTNTTEKPKFIKTLTKITEIRAYCKEHNIPLLDTTGKVLKSIDVLESTNNITTSNVNNTMNRYLIGDFTIYDYAINFTGSKYCAYASGPYPGTVTLSQSYSEAATVNSTVSVSSSNISATVGFSVTKSYTISPSYSITPSKAHGGARIYAYPRYRGSAFDIWRLAWQIGYGTAYRVIGTQFAVTYYK